MAVIYGTEGDDYLVGTSGDDTLHGLGGYNTLEGEGGADVLNGGAGNDFLHGSTLANFLAGIDDGRVDVMSGGGGDDTVFLQAGDQADGGTGTDEAYVSLRHHTTGVTLNLSANANAAAGAAIGGFLTGFERFTIFGSAQGDTITGTGVRDFLYGYTGADVLIGGGGSDYLYANTPGDDLHSIAIFDGFDDGFADTLSGGAGDDYLFIGLGDSADGGAGIDLVSITFRNRGAALNLDLNGGALNTLLSTAVGGAVTGVERVDSIFGTNFNDTINGVHLYAYGGDGNDIITATEAHSILHGEAGDDRLTATDGLNLLFGGAGDDTLIGGASLDTLSPWLSGVLASEVLQPGDEVVDGGAGTDTLSLASSSQILPDLFIDLGVTARQNVGFGWLTLTGIEDVSSGSGNDTILGTGDDNAFYGADGADLLRGLGGSDVLDGVNGDDTLDGGAGDDLLHGGDGIDTAVFSGVRSAYTLVFTAPGEVTVTGPDGTDILSEVEFARFADQTISLMVNPIEGTAAGETINGTAGDDLVNAGGGNDTVFGGAGIDILNGGDGNDTLVGNADIFAQEADTLNGDAGDDLIYAEFTDTLNGGAGRDSLIAVNAFNFTLNMATASIEYAVMDFGNDVITAAAQTVRVDVFAGGGNDNVTGSAFDDLIFGGAGSDTIVGGSGADAIVGNEGVDSLNGGAGDDRIYFDNLDSFVFGGLGYDAGYITPGTGAGVSINLNGASIEFIQDLAGGNDTLFGGSLPQGFSAFAGGGADTVDGSAFADILWGEAGDDTLNGNVGNDVLVGGAGLDRLAGGAGNDALYAGAADGQRDTFVFGDSGAANADAVYEFVLGQDKIDLSGFGASFAGVGIVASGGSSVVYLNGQLICTVIGVVGLTAGDFVMSASPAPHETGDPVKGDAAWVLPAPDDVEASWTFPDVAGFGSTRADWAHGGDAEGWMAVLV